MRKLTLYRDDSTTQVVFENVKHFFFLANNTLLAIAQVTDLETGEHQYILWPRERFCWFRDEPMKPQFMAKPAKLPETKSVESKDTSFDGPAMDANIEGMSGPVIKNATDSLLGETDESDEIELPDLFIPHTVPDRHSLVPVRLYQPPTEDAYPKASVTRVYEPKTSDPAELALAEEVAKLEGAVKELDLGGVLSDSSSKLSIDTTTRARPSLRQFRPVKKVGTPPASSRKKTSLSASSRGRKQATPNPKKPIVPPSRNRR